MIETNSYEESLSEIWTQVYPAVDLNKGAVEHSYRPDTDTALEDSTLTVGFDVPPVGESLPKDHQFIPQADGIFQLKEKIGEGGMGQIYRASQANLTRDVAIKVFQPSRRKAGTAAQFLAEARVTAWLDHPNIVPAYHLQEFPSGEIQLAMKLVGGESWAQQLNRLKPWDTETIPEDQIEILLQVCNAIAFAHSKGIVHLDLKPDNIMVGEFGEVLVLDWGLAIDFSESKDAQRAERVPHKSTLVHPCGTPSYMAPELALGQGLDIGPWTDCYLLGGILIKILTGSSPNKGSTLIKTLNNAARGMTRPLPNWIPRELKAIIEKSQSRETKNRYGSVHDFQSELRGFLTHRQSLFLSKQSLETLEMAGLPKISSDKRYQFFAEALSGFDQALKLWSENQEARSGRDSAIAGALKHALFLGDLGLARSNLSRLSKDHPEATHLAEQISKAEVSLEEQAELQERQRKRLKLAVIALIVGLVIGIISITVSELIALNALANEKEAKVKADEALKKAEDAKAKTASALEKVKKANSKAQNALIDSRRKLAQSYLMAGRFKLASKEQLGAELFFAKSLAIEESCEARQGLFQSRLAQVDGWSRSLDDDEHERPLQIIESENHRVLVLSELFDLKKLKTAAFRVRIFEPYTENAADVEFPWRSFELSFAKAWSREKSPYFSTLQPGHVYFPDKEGWALWNYRSGQFISWSKTPSEQAKLRKTAPESYSLNREKGLVEYRSKNGTLISQRVSGPIRISHSSRQKRFLAVGNNKAVTVIDVLGQDKAKVIPFKKGTVPRTLSLVRVSDDGRYLATYFRSDNQLTVWNTNTLSIEYQFENFRSLNQVLFSKDSVMIYVSTNNSFHVRRFGQSAFDRSYEAGEIYGLGQASRGNTVYVETEEFRALDISNMQWAALGEKGKRLRGAVDHPHRNLQMLVYSDCIQVWNPATKETFAQLPLSKTGLRKNFEASKPMDSALAERIQKSLEEPVFNLSRSYLHPDKPLIIVATLQSAFFYNYETRRIVGCILWDSPCYRIALSPCGRYFLSLHGDPNQANRTRAKLWSGTDGQFIREWACPGEQVLSLTFSPDSQRIYFGCFPRSFIDVWTIDGSKGKSLSKPSGDTVLENFAFADNGRFLLASDADGFMWIWDIKEGQLVASFKAHNGEIRFVLTADETALVTTSKNESLKIWDWKRMLRILKTPGAQLLERVQSRSQLKVNQLIKSNQ